MPDETVRLDGDGMEDLLALFVSCFEHDPYYAELFPDPGTRAARMAAAFRASIAYCVETGGAYGVFRDGRLAAFLLCFDYWETKWERPAVFHNIFAGGQGGGVRYVRELHEKIDRLGQQALYLLSLGVREEFRRGGLAGSLLDFLLERNPGAAVVSDISNEASLPLYRTREFTIEPIAPGYHYVQRTPDCHLSELCLEETGIRLAVAGEEMLAELSGGKRPHAKVRLKGYAVAGEGRQRCFVKEATAECEALLVDITYDKLLHYQRYLNLADCREECVTLDGACVLLYTRKAPQAGEVLWNDTLRDMVRTRTAEWDIIPDTQVLIPVQYDSRARLEEQSCSFTPQMGALLRFLDFRTSFEAGVPKGADEKSPHGFKSRICRYYLGKVRVHITQETTVESYHAMGEVIGTPANVDMLVSVDRDSGCGVFSLVSLSTPFLISHFMDNVIRNQLDVCDPERGWVNLYEYMERAFGLHKRGTPKLFMTIPKERGCLSEHQIASLLMAETIYSSDESMGRFTDEEILGIARSLGGMGQYDRAFVCVHTNVFLQFCPHLRGSVEVRLCDEAVTYFYIELLMFEEAAIQIASASIASLLSMADSGSTIKFLKKTLNIQKAYAETIEFWDIQVNYPSSKKSVSMIRSAFKIDALIERKKRDSEALREVFDTRRDIVEQTEAVILNYIVLFLTLMQGVLLYAPILFEGERVLTGGKLLGTGVITVLVILFWLLKKAASRTKR